MTHARHALRTALRRLAPLSAALALSAETARAADGGELVHLEVVLSAHAGLHSVVEDELNEKGALPVFGVGLAGFVAAGQLLLGAGVDAVTLFVEGDALAFAAAGFRRELSPRSALTLLAQAGAHHVSDCVDSVIGGGCNPGANLPFVGARVGWERLRADARPVGVWVTVARDLETRHVPEGMRSPIYGGTVVLLSLSARLGGVR